MKTFEIEGWFRYSKISEKYFQLETINCDNVEIAIKLFMSKYKAINFFKIYTKEIS